MVVLAIAVKFASEQYPASASNWVGVSPDCWAMVVIIGSSCFLSLVSCVTAWPTISCSSSTAICTL